MRVLLTYTCISYSLRALLNPYKAMLAAVKDSTTIHENRHSLWIQVDVENAADELIEDLSANRCAKAQALAEVAGKVLQNTALEEDLMTWINDMLPVAAKSPD